MALERRVVSINFVSGLDQKTDPKLTTKLTTADNVVLRKNGTIEKRTGFVANGTWSVSANPLRVFPFHSGAFTLSDWSTDNVVSSSDTSLKWLQRVEQSIGSRWTANNPSEIMSLISVPFITDTGSVTGTDSALIGASATQTGVLIGAAVGSGGITVCALDLATDAASATSVSVNEPVKMVAFSATSLTSYLVSFSTNNVNIQAMAFNVLGQQTAITTFGGTFQNGGFDAVAVGSKIYVVGQSSATQFRLSSLDVATSATSTTVIAASATSLKCFTIATPQPSTDRLRIFWGNASNTSIGYASFSLTLSLIQTVTTLAVPVALASANGGPGNLGACENVGLTSCALYGTIPYGITTPNNSVQNRVMWIGDYSDSGASLLATGAASVTSNIVGVLSSKPFIANGQPHVLATIAVATTSSNVLSQASTFVYRRWGTHHVASGRINYGIAAQTNSHTTRSPPVPQSYDGTTFYTSARCANYFKAAQGNITVAFSANALALNFSQTQPVAYAQLNNNTYIGGGLLQEYDGVGLYEAGFVSFPYISNSSTTNSGAFMDAGMHSVVVVKEYCNSQGDVYLGTPSIPKSFTVSANGSATIFFMDWPGVRNTDLRRNQNRYAIYMTTANGSIYYRVSSFASGADIPDTTSVSVAYSDANIATGDVLYTQGGLLPRWSPDSVGFLCAHQGRLFCDDPSNPELVRYSLLPVDGEGLQFATSNKIFVSGSGRVVAGVSMDSTLVLFRRRQIFVVSGSGPDDTGLNGSYSDAQLLFDDVGCVDQRNLCRFKDGIVFKSPDKGFYLLTRDLQLQFIGADVEDYNSKTVVSSEVVAQTEAGGTVEECRFLCSDGTLLTYNYYNGQWTTATLAGCTDAVSTGGRYVVVNPTSTAANARVFQQSMTTYLDAFSNTSTTYQMTVETGFVKTADVQGFQRIWKVQGLGESMGGGRISVEVGYDYETAYNETYTFSMSSMTTPNYTGGAASAPQFDFVPVRQKCQAIRFRIKDYPTENGAVMKITNLSLECGVKSGMFKLPAAKGA